MCLDKTGTITKGEMSVKCVFSLIEEEQFLEDLFTIESLSTHPLSIAILKYLENLNINKNKADSIELIPGRGLKALHNDITYYAGNGTLMNELSINVDKDQETKLSKEGLTIIHLVKANTYIGYVAIEDVIRETSYKAIKELKKHNIESIMVTGDNEYTAVSIGNKVEIDNVYARVTPKEKAQIILDKKDNNVVAFVGDGINDAVALTSADIGIAIGTGSDVAIASADVILPSNDLSDVVTLIELSKKTINNIKLNLFWAFFYNFIGIIIATGVFYPIFGLKLNPMIGALAMSFSSLSVVTNALRLRFFKKKGY